MDRSARADDVPTPAQGDGDSDRSSKRRIAQLICDCSFPCGRPFSQRPPIVIRFGTFDDGFDLTAADGSITVDPCQRDVSPLAGVTGPGPVLVALLQGAMPLPAAIAQGVDVTGDAAALTRVLPAPQASTNVPGQYS